MKKNILWTAFAVLIGLAMFMQYEAVSSAPRTPEQKKEFVETEILAAMADDTYTIRGERAIVVDGKLREVGKVDGDTNIHALSDVRFLTNSGKYVVETVHSVFVISDNGKTTITSSILSEE